MDRHRARLERNPRIGMIYLNWDRQGEESQDLVLQRAESFLASLD